MTTAARPTFDTAKGGSGLRENSVGQLSQLVSSRDLPGHLSLKERQPGQGTSKELRAKDFKAELEEREREAKAVDYNDLSVKFFPSLETARQVKLDIQREEDEFRRLRKEAILNGATQEEIDKIPTKSSLRPNFLEIAKLDASSDESSSESDNESLANSDILLSDAEADEPDDPDQLMAELNKIKRERAADAEKNLPGGSTTSLVKEEGAAQFRVKRRWDDDVPFKNCAPHEDKSKRNLLYLNDTVRKEFHKKFMDKYIR